jgi:hypothetical protein
MDTGEIKLTNKNVFSRLIYTKQIESPAIITGLRDFAVKVASSFPFYFEERNERILECGHYSKTHYF